MAQVREVRMIDDLDGSEDNVANVDFGIDGKVYEIDLSAGNAERLRNLIAPYVAKARRAGGRVAKATGAKMTVNGRRSVLGNNNAAIREWARANGFPGVPDRGRIPATILQAYATHNTATTQPTETTADSTTSSGTGTGTGTSAQDIPMANLIAFRQSKGLPCGPNVMTKSGDLRASVAKATREMMSKG